MFFESIKIYADEKTNAIHPLFPVGDQEYSGNVWSCYSPKQFLELTRFVFSSALKDYSDLMASEFSCLAGEMYTSQLMPCNLVGNLQFNPETDRGPVLRWYLLPLDHNHANDVDIDYRSNDQDLVGEVCSIYENHRKNRPELKGSGFIKHGQVLYLNCPTPVTDIVYEWLRQELKELGWINLF